MISLGLNFLKLVYIGMHFGNIESQLSEAHWTTLPAATLKDCQKHCVIRDTDICVKAHYQPSNAVCYLNFKAFGCKPSWRRINGSCFQARLDSFLEVPPTWTSVAKYCESKGASLMTLPGFSAADLSLTSAVVSHGCPSSDWYMIGGQRDTIANSTTSWRWLDGTKMGYIPWDTNQPNPRGTENGLNIRKSTSKVHDVPCNATTAGNCHMCVKPLSFVY